MPDHGAWLTEVYQYTSYHDIRNNLGEALIKSELPCIREVESVDIDVVRYRYRYPQIFRTLYETTEGVQLLMSQLVWVVDNFTPTEFDSLYRLYDGDNFLHYLIELHAITPGKG